MKSILKIKSRKGQLTLGDAPTVVLLVGLVFLVMATIAFIGQKYGDSFTYTDIRNVNESSYFNSTGDTLNGKSLQDARSFSVVTAINGSSGQIISPPNYTINSVTGVVTNATARVWSAVNITYDFEAHTSVAYNTTRGLQTEISNNTSIAGIVLTISLVGIVLTVLMSVFLSVRARRI